MEYEITGIATWLGVKQPDKYDAYSVSLLPEIDAQYEALALKIPELAEEEGIYVTMPDCLRELGEKSAEYLNEALSTDKFCCSDSVFRAKNKQQPELKGMERVMSGERVVITVTPMAYSFVSNDGKELDGVSMRLIAVRPA